MKNRLCSEIDTSEDLAVVKAKLYEVENRTVYMCFATDVIHSGHISIIEEAKKLGKLIIGVLSDDFIATYRRTPIVPMEERIILFENIIGVKKVIEQKTLSYCDVLRELKPTYVVLGDDWFTGCQENTRKEVIQVLAEYGGQLIDYSKRLEIFKERKS